MRSVVRLCEVRLENFKNTAYGVVKTPKSESTEPFIHTSSILGIFGQNGTGKTAIIEAVSIIRKLLSGGGLRNFPLADYIMYGKENCRIGARFSIEYENDGMYQFLYADYEVQFVRADGGNVQIRSEVLRAEKTESGKPMRRTLIDYDSQRDADCYLPKYRYEAAARSKEAANAICVAQRVARVEMASFLFSQEGLAAFGNEEVYADFPLRLIRNELSDYAKKRLYIVPGAHTALFGLEEGVSSPWGVNGSEVVNPYEYQMLRDMLPDMNSVLKEIIPGLTVDVRCYGKELCRNGGDGVRIEMFSKRGENIIPMRCESEGITRLVTLLRVLMCICSDPSIAVLIDGLDAGIFEYLLGELLTVLDDSGKGQLIFTAHSLRPLEMLDKGSLVFTTTNPENRYIPMQYVKQNNNLRDMYLRTIILGGQKEDLYETTDTNQIARAFRRAARKNTQKT